MVSTLEIDKKEMHTIKSAAATVGYSRDYINHLAREGKIVATQVSRKWYVDLESLEQYVLISNLEKEIKQKHLSEHRRYETELKSELAGMKSNRAKQVTAHSKQAKVGVMAFVMAGFLVTSSLSYFSPALLQSQLGQAVNSVVADNSSSNRTSVASAKELPTEIAKETVFAEGTVVSETFASSNEAIVLLPQGASSTVFSDEVIFAIDEFGNAVIRPASGENNSGLQYVVVPVSEKQIP